LIKIKIQRDKRGSVTLLFELDFKKLTITPDRAQEENQRSYCTSKEVKGVWCVVVNQVCPHSLSSRNPQE